MLSRARSIGVAEGGKANSRIKDDFAITSSGDSMVSDSRTSGSGCPLDLQSISFATTESSVGTADGKPCVRSPILSDSTLGFYAGVQTKREAEVILLKKPPFLLYHAWTYGMIADQIRRLPLIALWLDESCEYQHSPVQALGTMESVDDKNPQFQYVLKNKDRAFKSLNCLVEYYVKEAACE